MIGSLPDQLLDSALMRTFDKKSGSRPNTKWRILARSSKMRLDDEEIRKQTLTTHADHAIWSDTPYISFTNSPRAVQELIEMRQTRPRGPQKIVVVDPLVRLQLGLPILSYIEEMAYYGIESRYDRDYWQNHYLCLWEVTPQEVVGIWDWTKLREASNWYKDIIEPALQLRREERTSRSLTHLRRKWNGDSPSSLDTSVREMCLDDAVDPANSTGNVEEMFSDLRLEQN